MTLQVKSVSRNTYGEETVSWVDHATVWGKVEPLRGKEYFRSAQEQSDVSHRIWIRYRKNVTPAWRIKWGNRIFEIESVINLREENRWLEIMAREFVT